MIRTLTLVLAIALIAAQPTLAQAPKGPPAPPAPSAKTLPSVKADTAAILTAIADLKTDLGKKIDAVEKRVTTLETKVDLAVKTANEAKAEAVKATGAATATGSKVDDLIKKTPPPQPDLPKAFTGAVRKADGSWLQVEVGVPFQLGTSWYCYHEAQLMKYDDAKKIWQPQ